MFDGSEGEAEAARLVTFLAKTFRRERGVSNVVAIPRARVPIVKFCLLGVSVDLSFRNAMPIQNTALIKLFTSVHPCVRPYMMLVRFWAKTQNIAGGGKPATLLTNYALTMLMAFVLMNKQQILPPVAQLRNNQYRNVIINGWNCGFSDVIPYAYRQTRKYSIFELALNFFDYYANLDASQWVICPLLGRLVSKEDMNSKSMKRLPMLEDYCRVSGNIQLDTALCVQDPFDLIHNITRGLTRIPLERFQLLCRRSSVILQKIMDLQLPLEALFEPIELSDDSFSDIDGSEHRPRSQNEDGEPEVIDVDEETSDLSQDVEILTNDTQRPPSEPELIDLDDDDSSHGIKRSLTDDSGVGDVSTTMNISTNSVVSLDRKTFLSQLDLNSPYLYKFQVPSDKIVEVNVNTGALSYKEGQPRAEDVRWSGLNILKFVMHNIFATGVISRVTEGESPNKKMKEDPNLDTVHCFAILLVTFKHNLSESREVLMNLSPSYSSSTDSPFTFEKSLTDRLLKNMPKNSSHCSTSIFPFTVQFFVCYRPCEAYELLLVANASILSESVKAQISTNHHGFWSGTLFCYVKVIMV
ncbi:PAP/25A-associated [Trinorchestia longiramus]|nr:PAP/25A-associated [Trinorchestia longiramus]